MFLLDDYIVCYVAKGRRVSIARVLHGKRRERRAHREERRLKGARGDGQHGNGKRLVPRRSVKRSPRVGLGANAVKCVQIGVSTTAALDYLGLADSLFASRSISG